MLATSSLACLLGMIGGACGGNQGPDADGNGSGSSSAADGEAPDAVALQEDSGIVLLDPGDGSGGGPTCKGGLYTGTFTGNYTSSLTLIGFPVPVTGNLDMTLEESEVGSEFPVYTIENGVISGLVYGLYPFRCTLVGTLDCPNQKLVGGAVTCDYCVGPSASNFSDGGTCSMGGGHFEGPFNANYDSTTYAFIDGTWNGSEKTGADGGGAGGINDAGVYLGPGNYGGSGTWGATLGGGDP